MTLVQCVLLASAPGLFWLWTFYRRDRWEPEPKTEVARLFLLGALATVPAWFLERDLPGPASQAFDAFVRVALVEELCKLAPVWLFAYRRREFDEPMDGIVYAVAAALGFATVENVLYAMHLGPRLLFFRSFTATLAHVGLSGLAGYALGRAKFGAPRWRLALALIAVVALHGAYDLALARGAAPGAPAWVGRATVAIALPLLLVLLYLATREACRISPFRRRAVNPSGRQATRGPEPRA